MKKVFDKILIILTTIILILSVRGIYGTPDADTINESRWIIDGPFELSPERGRFALTYTLVEEKSVFFSEKIARFTLPDLAYNNGEYVSLFAPGVSFIAAPFYLLGKIFGASQFGAFLTSAFFAILNVDLIRIIAKKLGAKDLPATVSGLIFLFATPAFSYATTLYQHHISTFLILASLYTLLSENSFKGHVLIWFLYAFALTIDYPNAIIMLPILIVSFGQLISKKVEKDILKIVLRVGKLSAVVGVLPVFILFFWYNFIAYGSPLQFAGTQDTVYEINYKGAPILTRQIAPPQTEKDKLELPTNNTFLGFFKTKNIINGLYILLLSPDRGVIYFAPIVLFGFIGIKFLGKRSPKYTVLLVSIASFNLLIYSMWGDPWGGWAFGSRYLIPSYAIFAILISLILGRISRSSLQLFVFYLVLAYSIAVNTLGAVTSSRMPPKLEAEALSLKYDKDEKYTVARNWEMINQGKSKSFVFTTFANRYLSAWEYFVIVSTLVLVCIATPLVLLYIFEDKRSVFNREWR